MTTMEMTTCSSHTEFFDNMCHKCKKEYSELKGVGQENFGIQTIVSDNSHTDNYDSDRNEKRSYKEFTEERAKKLYGEILVQYLAKSCKAEEAARGARAIIRKQCRLRRMPSWSWTT
jgi:hypothetical protein